MAVIQALAIVYGFWLGVHACKALALALGRALVRLWLPCEAKLYGVLHRRAMARALGVAPAVLKLRQRWDFPAHH